MSIYKDYTEYLFEAINTNTPLQIIHTSDVNGEFGIQWRPNYEGLMAQGNIIRPKQGYFDFRVRHGTRYDTDRATHRDLFNDLHKHSNIANCRLIWQGDDPLEVGTSDDEKEALLVLALMMFEQEVNWGRNNCSWQRYSNFKPEFVNGRIDPYRKRPRDMIMGFVEQLFDIDNTDELLHWKNNGTVDFGPNGFNNYERRDYFTNLENNSRAEVLVHGRMYIRFNEIADAAEVNPRFQEDQQ